MKRDALDRYRPPRYPRRDDVPESELARHVPSRWRTSRAVAGALSILFYLPPGGAPTARADSSVPTVGSPAGDDKRKQKDAPPAAAPLARVFESGEGRGAFGCVAVAPPAFLTEADARQVILEEFAREGVAFELDKHPLPSLPVDQEVTRWLTPAEAAALKREPPPGVRVETLSVAENGTIEVRITTRAPHVLDGYDPRRRIGFEFISEEDYVPLGGQPHFGTVDSYDFRALAHDVAARASRDPSLHLGVFYDPLPRGDVDTMDDGGHHRGPHQPHARAQLREQVRQFIAYLKAHGVL